MTTALGRLFAAVAFIVAAVNIFTSLVSFQTNHDESVLSRTVVKENAPPTNNSKTTRRNEKTRILSTRNFLNCQLDDSPCSYFDPVAFYESPSSFCGYAHLPQAQGQLYGNPNRTLHANWARFRSKDFDMTYIHVRKAGGNTMYEFATQQQQHNIQVEIMPSVQVHRLVQSIGEEAFIHKMKKMVNSTTFFTFIRDPISRFVSAMGQVAEKKVHVLQAVGCWFPNDPTREMTCVLHHFKSDNMVNDHFIPASVEMYQIMFGIQDQRVAVLPLAAINDLLKLWDIRPFRKNEAVGIKKRYSVELLSEDMIQDLCRVYEADVCMMRSLGMSVPQCDSYISVKEVETRR